MSPDWLLVAFLVVALPAFLLEVAGVLWLLWLVVRSATPASQSATG